MASFWENDDGEKILDIMIPIDFQVGKEQIASIDIGLSMEELNSTIRNSILQSVVIAGISIVLLL